MAACLDVQSWRAATPEELVAFHGNRIDRKSTTGARLTVRRRLTQVDMYTYLRARFGSPNGFQNFLRRDDSDNLVHWDFNLKAEEVDVYILGQMRDVVILVSEPMTDEEWKQLILAIRADFGRVAREKSQVLKSLEKFVVFQNKFCVLADLCADLHASVVDAPPSDRTLPRITTKRSLKRWKVAMDKIAKRATSLYGDCLKLRLLTPIMAEAFLNMMIAILCKPETRSDRAGYDAFVREKIPEKLALLHVHCAGFARSVDRSTETYKDFLRIMNARNFAVHGNVDPVREQIETVYFEGKRPLFADNGDHILKLFEHLELINEPQKVAKDYEAVHLFLADLQNLLEPPYDSFFQNVVNDPYPGFEVRVKRVTKILPSHNAAMIFPNERWDDDLRVDW